MEAASDMVYIRNFYNEDDEDLKIDEWEVLSDDLNNSFDSDDEEEQDFMFMKNLNLQQDDELEQQKCWDSELILDHKDLKKEINRIREGSTFKNIMF